MVLKAENFGGTDLETLANMGITTDKSGRLRIGHAVAKEMGLGGGRWLKSTEDEKVPSAIKGYNNPNFPDGIRIGRAYSTIERFHLAAEAANGVPDFSEQYVAIHGNLEEQLDAARKGITADGVPTRPVLAAYWEHNQQQSNKGYAPDTPKQFVEGLVAHVEDVLTQSEASSRKLVDTAKATVMTEPAKALISAVEATYLQALVGALMPQVERLKERSYSPLAKQPLMETPQAATA